MIEIKLGIFKSRPPIDDPVENMEDGNSSLFRCMNGESCGGMLVTTNDERIDLAVQTLFPWRDDESHPLDAGLIGERDVVVMSRSGLRRGETDFFIRRGQSGKRLRRCSGWRVTGGGLAGLIADNIVHAEGADEFAAGIDNGEHIDFAAGFFHHRQSLAEGGGLVHNEGCLCHDLGER